MVEETYSIYGQENMSKIYKAEILICVGEKKGKRKTGFTRGQKGC